MSCEGYDYSDDDYVLAGSCGLRYTIDYTKEGYEKQRYSDSHNSYGWNTNQDYYSQNKSKYTLANGFADLITYVAVFLMFYAFYKTCISPNRYAGEDAYSNTNDDYPSGGGGGGGYGWNSNLGGGANYRHGRAPPPDYRDDASCHRNNTGGGGGGFWTGAAAGGLLGYMFGNRGGRNYGYGPGYGYGGGNGGFFNTRRGFGGGGGGGFSSGSSGTRSASGFGGTSRR